MDAELNGQVAKRADFEIPAGAGRDWTTFRASRRRGITVVELLEVSLVRTAVIHQLDEELNALIEAGHNRIVLDFGAVLHLSSQVLGTVLKAHRRCVADGGQLKLCEIQLAVAEIFALTGLGRRIEIYPEVRPAIESDWPRPERCRPVCAERPPAAEAEWDRDPRGHGARDDRLPSSCGGKAQPRRDDRGNGAGNDAPRAPGGGRSHAPLPVEQRADDGDALPAIRNGCAQPCRDDRGNGAGGDPLLTSPALTAAEPPTTTDLPAPDPPPVPPTRTVELPREPTRAAERVRLIVMVGRAQGQTIKMPELRLFIGRDPCCRIRTMNLAVSRIHAIIEQRCDRVFVRDIGSANGTFLNDRRLHGEEAEAGDGDRLAIGPLLFTFAIGPAPIPPPRPVRAPQVGPPAEPDPPSPPSIMCPRCGAEGWIPMDQVLRQLLLATGHAQPPPALLPVVPADAPAVETSAEYPLVPVPLASDLPIARGVPSPRPQATGRESALQPSAADPVDASLERAVQEALETLQDPSPEPVGTPPEESIDTLPEAPEARPHPLPPRMPADWLHFSCPECEAEGRTRLDQLDRQLCCKRCGARFYLDSSGDLVVGDRTRAESGRSSPWSAVSYAPQKSNPLEVLVSRWGHFSGPIGIALGAVALLASIGLAFWATTGPEWPATLEGRAAYAAEAFAHESRSRLQATATPGTSRDVGAWMNLVRPHFYQGKIREVRITISVPQQDGKKATVLAHVAVPGGSGPPDPRPAPSGVSEAAAKLPAGQAAGDEGPRITPDRRQIVLQMFWERDLHKEWRLDGSRTFKSAVRSRFWHARGTGADPTSSRRGRWTVDGQSRSRDGGEPTSSRSRPRLEKTSAVTVPATQRPLPMIGISARPTAARSSAPLPSGPAW